MMKKISQYILMALVMVVTLASCSETETYAEQRERELSAISDFINKRGIKVISEEDFNAKGNVTDTASNEYVLFEKTGVYMQIRDKGCGEVLKNGEAADVLCRFMEYNINADSVQLRNTDKPFYGDKMSVRNTSGTFTASFVYGYMWQRYSSSQVPGGWLVPLSYIKLGRPATEDEDIARVRLIVPHDQGTATASSNVYACYYEISYMRGK